MKTTKRRMFATLAAMAVLAGFSAVPMMTGFTAGAANTSITITQDGSTTYNGSFNGYQILTATDGGGGKFAYAVNEKYREVLRTAMNDDDATDSEIITYISGLSGTQVDAFAGKAYAAIKAASLGAEQTTTDGNMTNVAQGYYLIVDTRADGVPSAIIVDTAGNSQLKVTIKKDLPTLEKQVKDVNDSTSDAAVWGDTADYDIGDDVEFQLIATLPSNFANFQEYKLVFHDTLSDGFGDPTDIVVKLGDDTLTQGTDYTLGTPGDGCDLEVILDNVKEIDGAANDAVITVSYKATLTGESVVIGGAGNVNTAQLEYSNDPYYTGDTDPTSKTVKDEVSVFTYQVIINKVDATTDVKTALTGAEFTLEKCDPDGTTWSPVEVLGTDGTISTFTFKGLDDGVYRLTESKVPDGFNGIDPIKFTIAGTHGVNNAVFDLTALSGTPDPEGAISFTADPEAGSLTADVENKSGTELPSTGGIGTTIFYVVGGAMVLGAGIFLIAKKRMKNKDE